MQPKKNGVEDLFYCKWQMACKTMLVHDEEKKINTRQKPWTFSLLEQHCQLAEKRNCQFHKYSAILNNIALKIEKMTRLFTEESAMNLLEAIENFRQDTSNRTFPLKRLFIARLGSNTWHFKKTFTFACWWIWLVFAFCYSPSKLGAQFTSFGKIRRHVWWSW